MGLNLRKALSLSVMLPLQILLVAIDLTITIVTFGWIKALIRLLSPEPKRSLPVGDDESHRRHSKFIDELAEKPPDGSSTLYEVTDRAFNKYPTSKCMGVREYIGQKSAKVKEFGDVSWRTYADVQKTAAQFGAALRGAGLVAAPPSTDLKQLKTPCAVAIFENTCPEWMISALGCYSQSVITTTVYATLGMGAVTEAVNDCIISLIVCNKRHVEKVAAECKKMPTLKTIVYTSDMIAKGETVSLPSAPAGVTIISFEEFCKNGDVEKYKPTPPTPETTAVIMYTSGSTGKPKGVVATHANVVASVAAGQVDLGIRANNDVYLSYLPLAHILELMAEFGFLSMGCTLCYADPKTLTATGAYPIGALEQYSPTCMAGVPKIWDAIKKGIEAKFAAGSAVQQMLVKTAFAWRKFAISKGFDTPLFKAIIFKKLAAAVGGKMRIGISGGGPLNSEVQEFVRTAFGFKFFQGYGLTETCAGLTIQDTADLRFGIAGHPTACSEVKLESTPDVKDKAGLPYLSTDTKDVEGNAVFGRGEVLVKGPHITKGYYMMEEETKKVYRPDGFFLSGDIGQFMSDGSIRVVDRKKNLVKLKSGEYIALENMEMTYGNSPFVDAIAGGICCYGDGDMDRPIALMQLTEGAAMKWAKDNNVSGDFESVKKSGDLQKAVLESMVIEGKKGGLSHLEKLKAVAFCATPWTPENGCLTAANKLQRRAVVAMFEKDFEEAREKGIFK